MLDTRATDVLETGQSAPSRLRRERGLIGAALATIVFLQPATSTFHYDAGYYWNLSKALVGGGSFVGDGALALRGVLTGFLYLPAAVITEAGGNSLAGIAVLAENSVLIAVIGVVLIPALVALWRPVTVPVVVVSAVGAGVTLAGFAPFPLTDLWAAALLLITVIALGRRTAPWLLVAGLAGGAAFNIRPASLLPLAAVGLAVLVARRWSGILFGLGVAVALVPQVLLNAWRGSTWTPWPEMTGFLTTLQSSYAAYVVRYDTVFAGPVGSGPIEEPRRMYCSPAMAEAVNGNVPSSPGDLAGTLLAHMPQSLVFSAQKIGAALHWPLATPYAAPAPGVNALFALLVTAVAVIGAAALLRRVARAGRDASLAQAAAVIAWASSVVTLATSTTEARFALTLVVFGIAGCALLAADGFRPGSAPPRAWVAGALVAIVALFGVGHIGLGHPLEGVVTAAECADS
ncbi:hypothetical protein E4P39_09330 [Blastococcus sp. CT_GayMR19]|uniref:hypothetical protein n=1 Tax=Blastococcus sp. CT_GayMR19 TaxID=2559608 RepID=UPI001073079E|nr:hypothetical protein [Blastococcus sp. CT_GayMR19]TFV76079.1 hypothetical protein E4P39_09330 [Blastococcus sp. CT_GayMR19]